VNDDYQKLLPRTWQQAFYQAKAQKIEETLCVLYVAMTRARNALYMITKPRSSSDRRGTQSCDSIIQSILSPPELLSKPEALLIHPGAADWYAADAVTKPFREDQSLDATSAPLVMRLATDAASSPRRGLRIASPSTLASEKSMRLDRLFSVNEMVGGVVGSALHACFEQVQWLEDFSWDEERLRSAIRRALTPEQLRHISVEQQLVEFQRLLQLPAIRQSLSRERYQCEWWGKVPDRIEVENERRISLVFENQLIDGCIDRLVLLSQQGRLVGAEIIDYKTDQRDLKEELHSWQKRRVEYHRPQLQTYAKVVSSMMSLPLDKIECSLVLLSAGVRTPVSLS